MANTVLVTGVSGFIGRHVAQRFFDDRWTVFGIDTSPPDTFLSSILSRFYKMELPSDDLGSVLSSVDPQACVHCAGSASVGDSMADPGSDFDRSVLVTFNLLNSLRLFAPACRFLYPSSAAVYGNPLKLPVDEKQVPAPISPYGFHKLMCEQLAVEFHQIYGIPTTIVRIFSAYGEGLRRQVLYDICRKASSQKILRLHGTGNESRDFIHVSDVAQGMYLLIERSQCVGDVYNLASGTETTIRKLQELIVDDLGVEIKVEFDGLVVPGNPLNWRADMSRLSAMGFAPKVDLREGVGGLVRWYLAQEAVSG